MLGSGKRIIKRPFVNKRNRLILDNGKKRIIRKQKGGFWAPLVAALAPTAINLVKKIF